MRSSTLWVVRLSFLPLPAWTTFYWSARLFAQASGWLVAVQLLVTLAVAASWLFVNIRYGNRDRPWFRWLFRGPEWEPVVSSLQLLACIANYQAERPSRPNDQP